MRSCICHLQVVTQYFIRYVKYFIVTYSRMKYTRIIEGAIQLICYLLNVSLVQNRWFWLNRWSREIHQGISKLCSDKVLSLVLRQALIGLKVGLLSIETWTNVSKVLIDISNLPHHHLRKCLWKYRMKMAVICYRTLHVKYRLYKR